MKIIVLLFFLTGCISATKVSRNKYDHYTISAKDLKIDSYKTIDWKMRDRKETVLHQGFQIKLRLPLISKGDLEKLAREKGVDSYIIKIGHQAGVSARHLGYLEIPFYRYTRSLRSSEITGQKYIKVYKTYFQINYKAASLVPRTVNFICPPLKHRLKISDIEEKSFSKVDLSFTLGPLNEKYIRSNTQKFLAQSALFAGGVSLQGIYVMDIALYDSQKKRVVSSFVRVPEYIEVKSEEEISLKECDDAPYGGKIYKGQPFKWIRK